MTPQQTCQQCNAFIEALTLMWQRLQRAQARTLTAQQVAALAVEFEGVLTEARLFKIHATVCAVTQDDSEHDRPAPKRWSMPLPFDAKLAAANDHSFDPDP